VVEQQVSWSMCNSKGSEQMNSCSVSHNLTWKPDMFVIVVLDSFFTLRKESSWVLSRLFSVSSK
jgi:hypothetical protein